MARNKTFFKLFILLTLLYLAFQTKPWGSVSGAIYAGDDYSYYGYISSLVNDLELDFSNNELSGHSGVSSVTGKIVIGHPIGTSILLMPFYIAAKPIVYLLDWLTGTPFNQKHPLFFMFMCSGILLYIYLGGYLLFRAILLLGFDSKIAIISVILSIWATILPAYAFRRPILSHIPEFFLISLLIYIVIRWKKNINLTFKHFLALAFVTGGVLISRWNNIHILCLAVYWLCMYAKSFSGILKNRIALITIFLFIVFLVFFLTQSLAWKYFYGSYFTLFPLNQGASVSQIISLQGFKNLVHIFFGSDWGIVYTMLPFVIGLGGFLWFNPLSISRRRGLEKMFYFILFSLPFFIVLRWQRQADYYGYRYLLSLLPFACIGLCVILNNIYKRFFSYQRVLGACIIIVLAFNFLLMLPFEYKESTNLEWGTSAMGGAGFINNSYVTNAVKLYFTLPPKAWAGMFTRGFLGGYVFGGMYLFTPDLFLDIASTDAKIKGYYALDTTDKFIVLMYPLLVVAMLFMVNTLTKKLKFFRD
jgi:hypothetical protein